MAHLTTLKPVRHDETGALATGELGPGLHAGQVEMAAGATFRVRTMSGLRLSAKLADGVETSLVEQCMRTGQLVIMTDSERGPLIAGALQTQQTIQREPDGTLLIESRRIELRAEESVELRTQSSAVKLRADGNVRINGHRMLIDVDTKVRVLSALVELP